MNKTTLEFTNDEVMIINNALASILNEIDSDGEFHALIGADKAEVRKLLDRFIAIDLPTVD